MGFSEERALGLIGGHGGRSRFVDLDERAARGGQLTQGALSERRPFERARRPIMRRAVTKARGVRAEDRLLHGALGQTLGRRPGAGQVAVVIGRWTAIGDRIEAGLFLRADGGLDQRVAWRVDGEWRPGKGSEQVANIGRAA